MRHLTVLSACAALAQGLTYDPSTHRYEDLLVAVSPDLPQDDWPQVREGHRQESTQPAGTGQGWAGGLGEGRQSGALHLHGKVGLHSQCQGATTRYLGAGGWGHT